MIAEAGVNGPAVWTIHDGHIVMARDKERWFLQLRAALDRDVRWRDSYIAAECTGIEDVEGRTCYAVKLVPRLGFASVQYFDTKTSLRVSTTGSMANHLSDKIGTEDTYEGYFRFGGLLLPTEQTTTIGEFFGATLTIDSVDVNVAIAAERFDPPQFIRRDLSPEEIAQLETGPVSPPTSRPAQRGSEAAPRGARQQR